LTSTHGVVREIKLRTFQWPECKRKQEISGEFLWRNIVEEAGKMPKNNWGENVKLNLRKVHG
jgi:hypothetical protein